jgi:hypothetical protein
MQEAKRTDKMTELWDVLGVDSSTKLVDRA